MPHQGFVLASTECSTGHHPVDDADYRVTHGERDHHTNDNRISVKVGLPIAHRSSRNPRKKGCRTLPSEDLARYSISASSFGSTQMALCAILFA
jgi:hypothetical protein